MDLNATKLVGGPEMRMRQPLLGVPVLRTLNTTGDGDNGYERLLAVDNDG